MNTNGMDMGFEADALTDRELDAVAAGVSLKVILIAAEFVGAVVGGLLHRAYHKVAGE
jgi:F0F1-type ATP synthase assembly protein I